MDIFVISDCAIPLNACFQESNVIVPPDIIVPRDKDPIRKFESDSGLTNTI